MGMPLSEAERRAYAADAMNWLRRMAVGEVKSYDVRPAERDILQALRSDDLALNGAIEAASRLPSRDAQYALVTLVLSGNRPAPVRSLAAIELVRHIQDRGLLLTRQQIQSLNELLPTIENEKLKANVALVIGAMRPDAVQTGRRLERFSPPLESAAPPPAKEEKKEEEKKEEKKDEKKEDK
jgi:hypothetical protein